MEFGIEKCAILIMRMTHKGRNRTIKPRKDQSARRKENLEILRNTGSGHYQTSGDEGKH